MGNEILIAVIGAAIGSFITFIFSFLLDKRKEKREDRLEARKERIAIFQNRPEMAVVDYKDYISRTGYGIKQTCDIDLFVAHIDNVTTTGNKKNDVVYAHYRDEDFESKDWCCVIYTLKNAGKTDISSLDIICNFKRDTCIFESENAKKWAADNLLNYWYCYDKKVRVGETVTIKFCYHKDHVITGPISAIMSIVMQDDNGRYWTQPLFAPLEKLYDSRQISYKEYRDDISTEIAEECFKRPYLW